MTVNPLESWISLEIGLPRKTVLTRGDIEAWQRVRLQKIVEWSGTHSPFYKKRLKGLSMPADADMKSLLRRIPLTTAADLREKAPDMLCASQADIRRVVSLQSSGTSAPPKRLYFTDADLDKTRSFFKHGMRLVAAPDSRILVLLPGALENDAGTLLAAALNEGPYTARSLWPAHDPRVLAAAVEDFQAGCLIGLPQHILALARMQEPARRAAPYVKRVLLCSDYAAPCVRTAISETLDCPVHIHYGSTESGLGAAVSCSAHSGCHIRENDLLFEVVAPETGEKLPEGSDGELVFTTLTRTGMPLLRYRTGDFGRITTRRCGCGSILARLDHLAGRMDSRVALPGGGDLSLAELDQALLAISGIAAYEAELKDPEPADGEPAAGSVLSVTLVPGESFEKKVTDAARAALDRIPAVKQALTRERLGIKLDTTQTIREMPHTYKRRVHDRRSGGRN